MAARLTERQRMKIIADYLELDSYNAVSKIHGISRQTVKNVVMSDPNIRQKLQQKKNENTADILEYMERKRDAVCEIIGTGLEVLPEKIRNAKTASDVTTALGTLIDKWSVVSGNAADAIKEDGLSKSLREMAEGLESDDIS